MEDRDGPILHAEGFEEAVIGVATRCSQPPVIIYSHRKCVEILEREGMTEEEALEHISYNVEGAWIGAGTPMIMHEMNFAEAEEFSEGWMD